MLRDQEEKNQTEEIIQPQETAQNEVNASTEAASEAEDNKESIEELKHLLEKKENEAKELLERTQRLAAEFDNFRKRTQKEKEKLYGDAVVDIVAKFLPVVDNLERALKAAEGEETHGLKEGVSLVCRQMNDVLEKIGVKPIEAVGSSFNPELHNAVMHVEDESLDHNVVVEEFQKGYIYKDEFVVRHSMVKVAN